jgi:hypothetical protein
MSPGERDQCPKVFVSYSHDSLEHRTNVWNLAKRLRSDGIDAVIDQYVPAPEQGFPRWMEDQIDSADFVLLVCTEVYSRRVRGREEPGKGHGVMWEANLIYQHIYDDGTHNSKFIPVLFKTGNTSHIPKPLRAFAYYRVDTDEGYESLYRRISSQPSWLPPPIGKLKTFPSEIPTESSPAEDVQGNVSTLLKELLAARSIHDLERCLAKAEALAHEHPDNADVRLLEAQIKQALELERTRRQLLPASRRAQYLIPGITGLLLFILLLSVTIVGPRETVEATKAFVRAGMQVLSGNVPPPPPLPPPPPPPPPIPRGISITTLRDEMYVRESDEAVIEGHVSDALAGIHVYVLYRSLGDALWRALTVSIRQDGSWGLYADGVRTRYRWGTFSTLEILAVASRTPLGSSVADGYDRLRFPVSPEQLSKGAVARSAVYRVNMRQ